MDRPSDIVAMLLGSLGALAPEIVRLYHDREKLVSISFSLRYCLVSVAYALLGGVVAVCLRPSTWYSALYSGITLPFIVSGIAKNRPPKKNMANTQDNIIRASDPTQQPFYKVKKTIRTWINLIRDHADGLFL